MKTRKRAAVRLSRLRARVVMAAVVGLVMVTGRAADLQHGEQLFMQHCAACHTVLESVTDKSGPNLFGVFGRKAGTEDFIGGASEEIKASGVAWGLTTLQEFLASPGRMIRGTKMVFRGLPDADARLDLVCYLQRATSNDDTSPNVACSEGH